MTQLKQGVPPEELEVYGVFDVDEALTVGPNGSYVIQYVHFYFKFYKPGLYRINVSAWFGPPNDTATIQHMEELGMKRDPYYDNETGTWEPSLVSEFSVRWKIVGAVNSSAICLDSHVFEINVTEASREHPFIYEIEVRLRITPVEGYPLTAPSLSPPYWWADEIWYGEIRLAG